MPTRRGVRGGRKSRNTKPRRTFVNKPPLKSRPANSNEPGQKTENQNPVVGPRFQVFSTVEMKNDATGNGTEGSEAESYPFKVKVSNLPATYNVREFIAYFQSTFNIPITKIITPEKNNPWVILPFVTKAEQENVVRLLHNHVWKKKVLKAAEYEESLKRKAEGEEEGDPETKKSKVEEGDAETKEIKVEEGDTETKKTEAEEVPAITLEEEILSEHLVLHNVPYEEQARLKVVDVEILSNKLHACMCEKNPDLAGWAEAMCEQNGGLIFRLEPLKPSPLMIGYRNKCKFRIGKNTEGQIMVGFCSNDNESKILSVEPGDKFVHSPDNMKYATKKFEDYVRSSGKEPYDKKKKTGFWDHIIFRTSPKGDLMLIVVMYHNRQTDEEISKIKTELKDYFTSGNGKDCNLFSLYLQLMSEKPPILPPDKLELLMGEPSFEENICGLKFHVGPFTNINVNSPSAENIYKSVIELAEPTSDSIILDLCAGIGGISFTLADKCEKVYAIECQEENVNDAMKTMKINEIANVEFVKGRVEEELSKFFEKLQDKNVIPIIDPPRQGIAQKAIGELRANEKIKKLVYVCSNSKLGLKNFIDLGAASGRKEGNVEFTGLPFLPQKVIPIDVAPCTANKTIVILFERIDPSTFPPAKNPPPAPLEKIHAKKDQGKKTRRKFAGGGRRFDSKNGQGNRMNNNRRPSGKPPGSRFVGPPNRRGGGNRPPPMPMNVRGQNFQGRNNRFPPPLMGAMDSTMNLVAKYEKRIAELEQDNRAIKAGLSMGFQQGMQPGGNNAFGNFNPSFQSPGNFSQQNQAPMGNFQNQNFNQGYSGSPWLNNQGNQGNAGPSQPPSNFNNMGNFGNSNMGNGFGGGNFGPGGPGNFGGRNNPNFNRRNNAGGNATKRFGGGGGGPKNKNRGKFSK